MILSQDHIKRIKDKVPLYPRRNSATLPALTIAYNQLGYVYDDIYR